MTSVNQTYAVVASGAVITTCRIMNYWRSWCSCGWHVEVEDWTKRGRTKALRLAREHHDAEHATRLVANG